MKRSNHPVEALALILAAALCAFHPRPGCPKSRHPPKQGEQQQDQQQNKTFSGKIEKLQNGQYALITGQTPDDKVAGHFLDDQDGAKKYEGKQVTVTGTFDTASNTIHVTNIQAA